jgi:hypothetical protein
MDNQGGAVHIASKGEVDALISYHAQKRYRASAQDSPDDANYHLSRIVELQALGKRWFPDFGQRSGRNNAGRLEVISTLGQETLILLPCPFCEGPPCLFARFLMRSEPCLGELPPSDDGHFIAAFIFCHECGAESPSADEIVYDSEDMSALERQAAELWNQRDNRHRDLYDANRAEGRCQYPTAQKLMDGAEVKS